MSSVVDNDDWTAEGDLGLGLRQRNGFRYSISKAILDEEESSDFSRNAVSENGLGISCDACKNGEHATAFPINFQRTATSADWEDISTSEAEHRKNTNSHLQGEKFFGTGSRFYHELLRAIQKYFHCESSSKVTKENACNEVPPYSLLCDAKETARLWNFGKMESGNIHQHHKYTLVLQEELMKAQEHIFSLTSELEIARQLLQEKNKAAKILINKVNYLLCQRKLEEEEGTDSNSDINYKVNRLQYQLQCSEDHLNNVQQIWLERFNSVTKNNEELLSRVKNQEDRIKTVLAEKNAVKCERDELLGLLDYKERRVYQRSASLPLPNDIADNTAPVIELAVLGACICRGPKQEPCTCARSALLKQRRLLDVQKQLEQKSKLVEEMANLIDAQRETLEEEQYRSRELMKRLISLETIVQAKSGGSNITKTLGFKKNKTMPVQLNEEILHMLVDLLCDKTEALQHQRFVIKVLARRVLELEELAKQTQEM